MRDQYKILAEKYDMVQEKKGPPDYKKLVQDCFTASSLQEVIKIIKGLDKTSNILDGSLGENSKVLYKEVETLIDQHGLEYVTLQDLYNIIIYSWGYLLQTKRSLNKNIKNTSRREQYLNSAKHYLEVAKTNWKDFHKTVQTLRQAQKDLEQKNKETGINLDI